MTFLILDAICLSVSAGVGVIGLFSGLDSLYPRLQDRLQVHMLQRMQVSLVMSRDLVAVADMKTYRRGHNVLRLPIMTVVNLVQLL